MEEAKPAGGLSFGGGGRVGEGPPSSSLRPLALHCAEQWSGRVRPECLEVSTYDVVLQVVQPPQALIAGK